jgi:hypothetical protein
VTRRDVACIFGPKVAVAAGVTPRRWYRRTTVPERRGLVPVEVAAVLAVAAIPWPDALPVALPLFVAASLARWVRGKSWGEVVHGPASRGLIGALAGLAALALAVLLATPLIEGGSQRAIEWSQFPLARGNVTVLALASLQVVLVAVAWELALRGWIVERVLELSPGPPTLPVLVGAFAEAAVVPGDAAVRIGAMILGLGLGAMYVAGGRSVLAPIAARSAFGLGALFLETLRWVG